MSMGYVIKLSEKVNDLMNEVIASLVVISEAKNLPATAKVNLKNFKILVKKVENLVKDIELKHGI